MNCGGEPYSDGGWHIWIVQQRPIRWEATADDGGTQFDGTPDDGPGEGWN